MLLMLATSLQLASLLPHGTRVYVLNPPAYIPPPYESTLLQPASPEVVLLPDWLQRWLLLIRGQGLAIAHPKWDGNLAPGQRWHVDLEASLKGGQGAFGPALSLQGQFDWTPWSMAGNLTGILSGGGGWFMTGDGSLAHPPLSLRIAYWESPSSRGYSTLLTLRQAF